MIKKIFSVKQKVLEMKYMKQKSMGNVYMFHQINNDKSTWNDNSCCITESGFSRFINKLVDNRALFIPVLTLFDNELDKSDISKRIFITFDDAYEDVYYHCFPILKKNNIPFTIFLTVNYLNKHNYLDEKMVKEMLDSGLCTVGSHSLTHSILRKMSQDSVEKEFVNSRVELSRIFNTNVDILAYPFGSVYACSKDNIKAAQNTEYQLAFSTLNCHLTENNMLNRFFIPRKNVNENNYKEILRCWNAVN